jgi:hypothetical protein
MLFRPAGLKRLRRESAQAQTRGTHPRAESPASGCIGGTMCRLAPALAPNHPSNGTPQETNWPSSVTSVMPSAFAWASNMLVERVAVVERQSQQCDAMGGGDGEQSEAVGFKLARKVGVVGRRHLQFAQGGLDGHFPEAGGADVRDVRHILNGAAGSRAEAGVVGDEPQQRGCRGAGSFRVGAEVFQRRVEVGGKFNLAGQGAGSRRERA